MMIQCITGFHRDEKRYWVPRLACGHHLHFRHARRGPSAPGWWRL